MIDPRSVLREVYGYAEFRVGQAEAVTTVLGGHDAVVLLPTSAGKSLCYQVPAIALAREGRGTTVVVSPLIALMVDQVDALVGRGVSAAALHSHQDDDEQRAVIDRLLRGELALLYVSPERAALDSFKRLLGRVTIALLAIDEAHCVSQWGHDFRPEYMRLAELREVTGLRNVPMIAATATATPRVEAELIRSLQLRDPVVVRGDFRRPNLAFSVRHVASDAERLAATIDALERATLRGRSGSGRAIIYCSTRKKTESVADELKAAGFAAGHYHAGRTALARDRMHSSFAAGRTRVLVATSAFGMGVDYPDVRVTIHYQTPGSVEAYYQEAGRAGRDGEPSDCLMLFGPGDLVTQRRLGERGGSRNGRLEDALATIERYAHARRCRQQLLCAHFGAAHDTICERCDTCVDPEGLTLPPPPAPVLALGSHEQQVILDAVGSLARAIGKGSLAKALRGSRAKSVAAHGLLHIPQHGTLAHHDEASIAATIEELIRVRKLVRRGKKYPTITLPAFTRSREQRTSQPTTTTETPARSRGRRSASAGKTFHGIKLALDTYRKQKARQLRWKSYMIFQRATITAIDERRPRTLDELAKIPGLGPAKLARFGADILEIVRRDT